MVAQTTRVTKLEWLAINDADMTCAVGVSDAAAFIYERHKGASLRAITHIAAANQLSQAASKRKSFDRLKLNFDPNGPIEYAGLRYRFSYPNQAKAFVLSVQATMPCIDQTLRMLRAVKDLLREDEVKVWSQYVDPQEEVQTIYAGNEHPIYTLSLAQAAREIGCAIECESDLSPIPRPSPALGPSQWTTWLLQRFDQEQVSEAMSALKISTSHQINALLETASPHGATADDNWASFL